MYYASTSDFTTYYDTSNSNKEGYSISLSNFKKTDGTTHFTENTLRTNLTTKLVATAPAAANTGCYNVVNNPSRPADYDIYLVADNGTVTYYKYVPEHNGAYDLRFPTGVTTYDEDYYISMFVPAAGNADKFFYYMIINPDSLTGEKSAKVNLYNTYNVPIADLFTQSTSMTVGPEVETITVSDNKITVNAETTVRLKDENTITHVQGSNLYHSLKLDLDRYSDTGVTNEIYGLDSSRITAKYWLDDNTENKITVPAANITVDTDSNFINIQTAEISNGVDTDGIKINVEVEMTFA